MNTILVIDDMPILRDPICFALRAAGYQTLAAGNGQEALDVVKAQPPELVLLDVSMPVMDGMDFLREMRAIPSLQRTPVILLTSKGEKKYILDAAKLGVRDYLLKTIFTFEQLLDRVKKYLPNPIKSAPAQAPPAANAAPALQALPAAPSPAAGAPAPAAPPVSAPRPRPNPRVAPSITVPNLVSRDTTLSALASFCTARECRTLSGVVAGILRGTGSAGANLSEVAATVRQDPLLALRIVHAAGNPAVVAPKGRINSLEDAVRNLGSAAVREMAQGISVFDAFAPGQADGLDLLRCWQHCNAVATIMQRILPRIEAVPPGLAHLAGLCHDIDEILLRQRFPGEFAAAADLAHQAGTPIARTVPTVFGATREQMLETILGVLAPPQRVTETILEFARGEFAPTDAGLSALARGLRLANYYAHAMQFTSSAESLVAPLTAGEMRSAMVSVTSMDHAEIHSEVAAATSTLANLGQAAEKDLMQPLLRHSAPPLKIWYARHQAFAVMDPLEEALRQVGLVTVRSALPVHGNEVADVAAIVVASPRTDQSPMSVMDVDRARKRWVDRQVPILYVVSPGETAPASAPPGMEIVVSPLPLSALSRLLVHRG